MRYIPDISLQLLIKAISNLRSKKSIARPRKWPPNSVNQSGHCMAMTKKTSLNK